MNENHIIAGKALKLLLIGQLITVLGTAVSMIPLLTAVAGIAGIVGYVVSLVGLFSARPAHERYRKAVTMLLLSIVLTIASSVVVAVGVVSLSAFIVLLGVVLLVGISLVALLQVYYVCTASSALLREAGDESTAAKGDTVWKLNAICYLATGVLTVVSMFSAAIAGVGSIISGVLGIVAGILYIVFLYQGSQTLNGNA